MATVQEFDSGVGASYRFTVSPLVQTVLAGILAIAGGTMIGGGIHAILDPNYDPIRATTYSSESRQQPSDRIYPYFSALAGVSAMGTAYFINRNR